MTKKEMLEKMIEDTEEEIQKNELKIAKFNERYEGCISEDALIMKKGRIYQKHINKSENKAARDAVISRVILRDIDLFARLEELKDFEAMKICLEASKELLEELKEMRKLL